MLLFTYTLLFFFFFNDTATTEIYTLSLHDALPIYLPKLHRAQLASSTGPVAVLGKAQLRQRRSEEHTSELQSPCNLVCRLLLEKKKKNTTPQALSENQPVQPANYPKHSLH